MVAQAQQSDRVRRVGVLMGGTRSDPVWQSYMVEVRDVLETLGWTKGRNLRIDLRFGEADASRMRIQAAELVMLAPEVLLAASNVATAAVQEATATIPIIAVGAGLREINAARPGGNVTGFTSLSDSIGGKWVELLKEAAPRVEKIRVLFNPDTAPPGRVTSVYQASIEAAAQAWSVQLVSTPFCDEAELERATSAFAAKPSGLVVIPSIATATRDNRQTILLLAAGNRLPVIDWDNAYPAEGGLMSYGSNFADLYRRAAYIDRIRRGAKASELPVEFPTRFELVVNLKAAKTIDLAIPEAFLLRADEVIE
jgi:putative tryptophan/tyrosine transport system substrate-binding protein